MPKIISKDWYPEPIEDAIINILVQNRGEMLSTDLFRKLAMEFEDFTRVKMKKIFFRLEVRSFIHVIPIKKDVLKIEISRNANFSKAMEMKVREFMH
jgi:hypothetical protein